MSLSRRSIIKFGGLSVLLAACGQAATPTPAPKPADKAVAPAPAAAPTNTPAAAAAKPTEAPKPAAAATVAPAPAAATKPAEPTKPAAAAGPAPTATPYLATVGGGQKEIWWATPGNPDELKVYQASAEQFAQKNPGYKVKLDRNASDNAKLVTMIAGNQAPDVIFATINNFPQTGTKNVWAPLDDYIKADSYDIQDFYDQILKPYRMEGKQFGAGKLHGIPKEIAIRSMYYNAGVFNEVGVKAPDPKEPWTWDQFQDAVLKSVKREGDRTTRYGYVQETWWGMWAIWAWANGGEVVDSPWNPTKATMSDERVVQALQFWTDFVVKHKAAPSLAVMQQQGRSEIFAGGLSATYNNGRWMVPLFRKSTFKWDVMPMPKKEQRAQLLTGSIFGIWSGSKQKDDGWKLLAWVNGKESQKLMTELGLLFPSRRSVAESDVFLKSNPPTNNQVYLDDVQHARILPMHPAYPEMEKAVNDEVALVMAGNKTAKDAVAVMDQKVNALLKQ